MKIGRNDPCPCGRRIKFKNCCFGTLDWPAIFRAGRSEVFRNLSVRGKNIELINRIGEALQLDKITEARTLPEFKRAFTPNAVRQIHEAVVALWPPDTNPKTIYRESDGTALRAIFVGRYELDGILAAVARHSVYTDVITLADPLLYAPGMREQYDPILNPEQYVNVTYQAVRIWMMMLKWVDAGLVELVRPPFDFDIGERLRSYKRDKQLIDSSPELKKEVDEWVEEQVNSPSWARRKRQFALHFPPDDYLLRTLRKMDPSITDEQAKDFLAHIHEERENDPDYLAPAERSDGRRSEMAMFSSGMGLSEARSAAALYEAHLITDIRPRWRMLETDRAYEQIDSSRWTPLSKAFSEVGLKYLNNIDIRDALEIRKSDRLDNMRAFLRKIWRETSESEESPYRDSLAADLGAELHESVRETETAWAEIDRELLKKAGGYSLGAAGALGVATGGAAWLAGAAIGAGAALATTMLERAAFPNKYPGAFFMDLKRRSKVT